MAVIFSISIINITQTSPQKYKTHTSHKNAQSPHTHKGMQQTKIRQNPVNTHTATQLWLACY